MIRFKDISIKYKLTILISCISVLATLLGAFLINELEKANYIEDTKQDAQLNAILIGQYTVSAIVFEDKKGALDILKKIDANDQLIAAAVYDTAGAVFAEYIKATTDKNIFNKFKRDFYKDSVFLVNNYGSTSFAVVKIITQLSDLSNIPSLTNLCKA